MEASIRQAQTARPCLQSFGLTVGGLFVPPFSLRSGESLCLHVGPSTIPWYDGLLPLFTGKATHPGLQIRGSVRYLERPMPRRRWWGRLDDPSISAWLLNEARIDPERMNDILARLAVTPDVRIGYLGGDPRTILALEAVLAHPPNLLVFDTAGNSPQAIQEVFGRLSSRPPEMALTYLKLLHNPDAPCVPGAVCLDLVAETKPLLAVE